MFLDIFWFKWLVFITVIIPFHPGAVMRSSLKLSAFSFCLLLFLPIPAWAEFSTTPKDLTDACETLAQTLSEKIPVGKTVAVRRFSSPGGIPTVMGVRVQDLLTNALSAVEPRKFHVVERLRMAELDLERMTFGSSRGDDLDQWAWGLKADLVVMGTCGDLVGGMDKSQGYYQLHRKDLKILIRKLAVLPRSAWWEESVEFWVME